MLNNYPNSVFAFNCIPLLELEINNLKKKIIIPSSYEIAILLTTNDIPSIKYVAIKKRILASLAIKTKVTRLLNAKKEEIYQWLEKQNNNKRVLGIIIQYPVSANNRSQIIKKLNKFKDIDGLHAYWRLKLQKNGYLNTSIIPPTTYAIMKILNNKELFTNILKKNIENFNPLVLKKIINHPQDLKIHVLGFSSLIGKPIYEYFQFQKNEVTFSDIETKTNKKISFIKNADIVITTTGKENSIKEEWLQNGQVVIDFGRRYKKNQVYGDIQNKKLPFGVVHTTLFKSTGYATLGGLLHNIGVFIDMQRSKKWK